MIVKERWEIENLRKSGQILVGTLELVANSIRPGISAWELNQIAEDNLKKNNALPSFKNYRTRKDDLPFPSSLCVSVNDEVVHGIASKEKVLTNGDIVGLDLGVIYKNLYTDAAVTLGVGRISPVAQELIDASKESLSEALKQVKPGNTTGDIGFAIQSVAEKYGFQPVRELVGHGVGKTVHEDPEIPCFGEAGSGSKLKEGMVLAIEPMINQGNWKISFSDDGWTVKTADNSLSSHQEHTVLVTNSGCEIITKR